MCVKSISRVFQGSCIGIKGVSCGYQEGLNQVSRVFQGNFKSVVEVFLREFYVFDMVFR